MKPRFLPRTWTYLLAGALVLQSLPVLGADALKDDPRARQFFEVGAQAYSKGQYLLAIDAFKEAFALTQRPGLLFSLAQAHQRQFRASGEELHLTQAIDHYRRYLAKVPSGGRHDDAATALNVLLVVAERLHPTSSPTTPARTRLFGKLLLSSPTPQAKLTVNGDEVESLPTALELPADKYRVVGTAPGFEVSSQEVMVEAGSSVPLNLELRPLPAKLRIAGPAGAEAFVDGRPVGWLPLGELSLPAGVHAVSLRKQGKKTRSASVRLQRGQTASVDLPLESTVQRQATWVAGAGALVGLAVTVPLAVLAAAHDNEASDLDRRRRAPGGITQDEGLRLNAALDSRDELRTGAIIAGVTTGALLGSALVLYFADTPAPPWSGPTQASARATPRGLGFHPVVGSAWGFGARASF